jgi:hypothetical protein
MEFWVITAWSPLKINRNFGRKCLYLQDRSKAKHETSSKQSWRWKLHVPSKCGLISNEVTTKVVIYTDRLAFSGQWERQQVSGMGWNETCTLAESWFLRRQQVSGMGCNETCTLAESWFLRNAHLEDQDENIYWNRAQEIGCEERMVKENGSGSCLPADQLLPCYKLFIVPFQSYLFNFHKKQFPNRKDWFSYQLQFRLSGKILNR